MKRAVHGMIAVLGLFVLLAGAVNLAAAAPGGNADNAKRCQKNGWQSLAMSEDPYTAFIDQDACVSYGAQGGAIVPLSTPPPSGPVLTFNGSLGPVFVTAGEYVVYAVTGAVGGETLQFNTYNKGVCDGSPNYYSFTWTTNEGTTESVFPASSGTKSYEVVSANGTSNCVVVIGT